LRKLMKTHRFLLPIIILAAVLLVSGVALAVTYSLNKTVPATVTIVSTTAPASLYTDSLTIVPVLSGYTHNFGTVVRGGTTQSTLWFRADEVNPATINVVFTGLPAGVSGSFGVGAPSGWLGRPTALVLSLSSSLSGAPAGSYNFSFTVTGSSP
jgi:hypothetical protein